MYMSVCFVCLSYVLIIIPNTVCRHMPPRACSTDGSPFPPCQLVLTWNTAGNLLPRAEEDRAGRTWLSGSLPGNYACTLDE